MKYNKTISFLFEVGTLRKIARSHRQTLLTDDISDNIAAHSFRVTMIGLLLAEIEKVNIEKVLIMCLLHDIEESRTGDQNWVHKRYLKVAESSIREEQLANLSGSQHLAETSKEYETRQSREARIAKDADLLDQILLLREYTWQGNHEAEKWLAGKDQEKLMFTTTAKKLAHEAYQQNPSDWWQHLWINKRRG